MRKIVTVIFACAFLLPLNTYAETGVSRSAFTTAIEDKEPVSELKQITTDISRVYYFTELLGLNGHMITHRWEHNGQVLAEISFKINADRWRTWSSKSMLPSWIGKWQVSVLDEGGNIIEQSDFEYIAPQQELQPQLQTQPVSHSQTEESAKAQ